MPRPSDFTDDEWVAAFAEHKDARNHQGRLAIRPKVAEALGLSPTAVTNYLTRNPGLRDRCHEAAGLSPHPGVDQLLRDQGVDPSQVTPVQITANRWGDPDDPSSQLKVRVVPRWSAVLPARTDGWKRPRPRKVKAGKPRRVAVFSDHHCPHVDPELHKSAVAWLRATKPDEIVVAGDLLDYDAVSRHRANPGWAATLQDCIDSGYRVLRDYRCTLIAGNHEDRLRNAVLDNLRAAFGVTRAKYEPDEKDHAVLSLPHLLRLDELGIDFVGGQSEYQHYRYKLSDTLAVRHGYLSKTGAGASAVATIRQLRHSVVIGHCHRLAVVHLTEHDIDGKTRTIMGAESGTMARIEGGLGYAVSPDWQQGFLDLTVWPDGSHTARPVPFVGGRLLY